MRKKYRRNVNPSPISPLKGVFHRIIVRADGQFTLKSPISGYQEELIFYVINASAGEVDLAFEGSVGAFNVKNYIGLRSGKGITSRFMFDTYAQRWVQIGDWSPESP